ELKVYFDPDRLDEAGIPAPVVADSVAAWFRDQAAGRIRIGDQEWSLRYTGTSEDPVQLGRLTLLGVDGERTLDSIATVERGREKPTKLVRYEGRPAVMLAVMKQARVNTLDLVEQIHTYVDDRNRLSDRTGTRLVLADDQTVPTRKALDVMQRNALLGLSLVLIATWMFLGFRIALFTTLGIPFTLAGTFWVLYETGNTINTSVLLGTVIALGMIVDDAVVVVEGIAYRIGRGMDAVAASVSSLREVFAPVTTSVLTTMAAFLPLVLLPGILGEFMRVLPMVVTIALAISLAEAYWMLPAHVIAFSSGHKKIASEGPRKDWHWRFNHAIRVRYSRLLLFALRHAKLAMLVPLAAFVLAITALGKGWVHVNFFALESYRLFYVNIEMPAGTPVDRTIDITQAIEDRVRNRLHEGDARSVVSYAGQQFTQTEPLVGDHLGQIMVSLNPKTAELREVEAVVEDVRTVIHEIPGPVRVSMLPLEDGPPTGKPISIKVRGDRLEELEAAADAIKGLLANYPAVSDISDDASPGPMELSLRVDPDAARRAGINPADVARTLGLLGDGEVVASMQHEGEALDVRVQAKAGSHSGVDEILRRSLVTREGTPITLAALSDARFERGSGAIRHYNFLRTITVEAELDKLQQDVQSANQQLMADWNRIRDDYPGVSLDFSGELDDIQESLDAIYVLFIFGIGLIYLILGTQFGSYFQPFMILATVPMAFTGVVLGLWVGDLPFSLFTLYGFVALAGIAVNSAIVLISAANVRLEAGMSVLHATVYAARRRVVPILITALTTIAGLFSLATGLGGKSLLWGPVATAIVWGLAFSTALTLFVVPILYRGFMGWGRNGKPKPHQ
ncbi:MAG: efflux RND transporter permease subunit, partial [Gammaproteobacteria bacterium]